MSEARDHSIRTIMARAGVDRTEAEEILAVAIQQSQTIGQHVTWDEAIDIWVDTRPPVPKNVDADTWKLIKNLEVQSGDLVSVILDDDGSVRVTIDFFKPKDPLTAELDKLVTTKQSEEAFQARDWDTASELEGR